MRTGLSAALFIVLVAGTGRASAKTFVLDTPAGSVSAAIAVLVSETGASIGSRQPEILRRIIPPIHARGSTRHLVDVLVRQAQLKAEPLGNDRWVLIAERIARGSTTHSATVVIDQPIIVEATKQNEILADLPAELVQVPGSDLAAYGGAADTRAMSARVPALGSTDWGNGHDKLFLRGIADSSFAGTSPALVGQYWEDLRLTFNAPDPDLRLYDVAGVEVLEGPQGTLYGAGALGGLIRVQPKSPSITGVEGWLSTGVAATAHGGTGGDIAGMINVPLVDDRLGLRIVGYDATEAGYIDDTRRGVANINQTRTYGGRATLRWRIGGDWTVDVLGIGQRIDNRDAPYADMDAAPLTRSSRFAEPSYNRFLSGSVVISGTIGDATLRSTTGVVDQSFGERFEVLQAFNSLLFAAQDKATLISHETRLSGHTAKRGWVIGVGFLSSEDRENRFYGRGGTPPPLATIDSHATEVVGYGQLTQHILPRFSAMIGARIAFDRLSATATDLESPLSSLLVKSTVPVRLSDSQVHVSPSGAFLYRPNDKVTIFLRYGSNYRPGGVTASDKVEQFRGDRIDALEAGVRRGTPGSDRISFTITGALSRWHHVQADLLDGLGVPYVANIGNGVIGSLDGMIALRICAGWQFSASGLFTRNHLHPDVALAAEGDADRLPNVVDESVVAAFDHSATLVGKPWRAGIRIQHVGHSLFGIGPLLAVPQGGYTTLAMGTSIRAGRASLQVDATNLLDSRHNVFATGTPFAGFVSRQITPLRPRTVRIGLRYDF
jgi:iron complex outermembrane receptor protein